MKLSLKWKFVIALTIIPMVSIGVFFIFVYNNFKSDRLASIYESTLTQSRLLTKLTAERITPLISFMEYWAQFYYRDPAYSETIVRTMHDSTSNLKAVSSAAIVDYDPLLNKINYTNKLAWAPETLKLDLFLNNLEDYRRRLEKTTKPLIVENLHAKEWTLIQKFKKDKNREIYILTSFSQKWVRGRFAGQIVTNNFWVGDQGQVLAKNTFLPDEIIPSILKIIVNGKSTYGSFQVKFKGVEYIASYTVPNQAQLVMINLIKSSAAYEALSIILDQSLILLGIFIAIAGILGIILSKQLTSALEVLLKATQALGRGIFNIRLNIKTGDEIEELGKSVIKMSADIQHLMNETKDLGRMESELLLAKEVQSTLFPPDSYDSIDFSLRAFSKSASECGGDWWTYFETDDDFFVIVGDATGHGVPAALLTSAINSLTALLYTMKITSPREMLVFMNNALHQTSQGKKSMTMSLLKINKTTGIVRFANASHESPLILRNLSMQTKFSQLTSLDNPKSQPLGYLADSDYEEGDFQLQPNDTILVYTDGAPDARNLANQAWGERKFSRPIIEGLVNSAGLDHPLKQFVHAFKSHTIGKELIDDVTVILVQYKGAA